MQVRDSQVVLQKKMAELFLGYVIKYYFCRKLKLKSYGCEDHTFI